MAATLHSTLSGADIWPHDAADDGGATRDLLARIEQPSLGDDPAARRRHEAEELVAAFNGDREQLEQIRARFHRRLHRASDDFGATEGLRVVEVALPLVPWPLRRGLDDPAVAV